MGGVRISVLEQVGPSLLLLAVLDSGNAILYYLAKKLAEV
jgi:hypothetical protein